VVGVYLVIPEKSEKGVLANEATYKFQEALVLQLTIFVLKMVFIVKMFMRKPQEVLRVLISS